MYFYLFHIFKEFTRRFTPTLLTKKKLILHQ